MGTKTGDGGFEIDGKTYTFDVGDPDAEGVEPTQADHGDLTVDNSKRDISKKTRETIGQYLSDLTKGNDYPIDADISDYQITTKDNVPASITDTQNSAHYANRENLSPPGASSSQNTVHPNYTDPLSTLDISKGKESPQKPNGNSAIVDIVGGANPDLKNFKRYTSTVLSNNRFSDAARAANVNLDRPGNYNPQMRHPHYGEMSANRLAQVGVALSVRASQEMNAANAGNNPSSGGQIAKSILPGWNQLGASRINTTVLEAKDVLETLTNDEIDDSSLTSIAPGGSWGSLNNVHDPFSGINALGMIALSIALTAAIVVLFEGLGFLLSLVKGGNAAGADKHNDGRYILGRYTVTPGTDPNAFPPTSFPPDLGALIGIRPTVHPFSAALQSGVAAFFGIDTSSGLFGQITSGLTSSTENPGYNVVVARSIIRSGLAIIDSFKNAFDSPNIITGVQNILAIVDTLRSSKLISAMNVFANLGDALLVDELKDETVGVNQGGRPEEPTKKSRIDRLDDNAGAVSKNRLRDEEGKISLKLAWSSNRAPASYIIPEPLLIFGAVAGNQLGAPQFGAGLQDPASKTFFRALSLDSIQSNGSRLPYDSNDPQELTVKRMEGILEGEYMPFYFHDLRTNEIISFHAFITQLNDDYTANWEGSDSYGRVDQVRVYKSTQRKISVGFMIVATSEEDFNDMWLKINKLITLVYPQYTQGRLLTDTAGNFQFTQPFSQMIGASPLIRLRLGDLFRSNYSRFALARLFGADSNLMKLGPDKDKDKIDFSGAESSIRQVQIDLGRKKGSPAGNVFVVSKSDLSKPTEAAGLSLSPPMPSAPGVSNSGGDKPKNAPVFNVPEPDLPFFRFKVDGPLKDGVVTAKCVMLDALKIAEIYGYTPDQAQKKIKYLKSEYGDITDKPIKNVIGGTYVIPYSFLKHPPEVIKEAFNEAFKTAVDSINKLTEFLSPDSNALVKSFQSVEGKGLAGTIDSINFDWYENVTWELTPGSRAPKMCKVSISFSPIHDISPGIDANGFNRGPIYPVAFHAHSNDNRKGK